MQQRHQKHDGRLGLRKIKYKGLYDKSSNPSLFVNDCFAFHFANEKIVITGNDTMKFSTREFSVPAGKKVELEFKNVGKLPKIAMGHN